MLKPSLLPPFRARLPLSFSKFSIQRSLTWSASNLVLHGNMSEPPLPRRQSARIRTMAMASTVSAASAVEDNVDDDDEPVLKKKKRKRVSKQVGVATTESKSDLDEPKTAKKKKRPTKSTESTTVEDQDQSPTKAKKARKPREPKPEPVYVIPDVQRRETRFRGRLGYACLNTVLRNKKPASQAVFCSRTCRIDSIKKNGMEWVKELGTKNVQDLITMIQWNEDNKIRFLRMSSEMFPFASHSIYGYSLDYCAPLLAEAGALAEKYGHRLTTHPGQFTQLGSPKPGVVQSSIRELEYHCEMLDLMGIGKDGVMIIHGGGVYEDKPATLKRLKMTIRDMLPKRVRDRLVLENDELCYNAEDLLPICEELDIPLVFDYHHDSLYPSSIAPSAIIQRANAIFHRRGIRPKQHLSEPRPGAVTIMERRAHADRCERLPSELEVDGVSVDVDLMIEAKDKEQAVLQLYRMYGLEEVKHESLRPPNPNPTTETKGRKSNKKASGKKKKRRGDESEEEDDEGDQALEDEEMGEEQEQEQEG